jgi:hypothetical protein
MQAMLFIATISDKRGRTLYESPLCATREGAAADAFLARPKAKRCTTCRATPDGKRSHLDIRSHNSGAR